MTSQAGRPGPCRQGQWPGDTCPARRSHGLTCLSSYDDVPGSRTRTASCRSSPGVGGTTSSHAVRPSVAAGGSPVLLCGIALPLGLLVADGGQACADIRWYCKDVMSCTDRWTAADRPERAHIPVPGYAFAVAGTRLRMRGRRLRMERRQNSRAAWSKRQSPPCNRVPQLQRGPGVIEVIKGTATARSG